MKVQRVRLPSAQQRVMWLVLDDRYLPVEPICAYLTFRASIPRSPNTIRTEAHHLKLFWDFLREQECAWTDVDIQRLGAFVRWLRRPQVRRQRLGQGDQQDDSSDDDAHHSAEDGLHRHLPGDPGDDAAEPWHVEATIDQILTAVHTFYDFHQRLQTGPDLALYRFLTVPHPRYKPLLYGLARSTPRRRPLVQVQSGHTDHELQTLTRDEVHALQEVCRHLRDRFLVALLHDTGMRIGQALGLRHSDISVENQEIRIVPRDDNVNEARAKTRTTYCVYPSPQVCALYVQYLVDELGALESTDLPDYVFVNLWAGERGRPLDYDAVRSLFRRLSRKTGIQVMPHMLRHTRATEWIQDDVSLPVVSRALGHASITTTEQIYVHRRPRDVRAGLLRTNPNSHPSSDDQD